MDSGGVERKKNVSLSLGEDFHAKLEKKSWMSHPRFPRLGPMTRREFKGGREESAVDENGS